MHQALSAKGYLARVTAFVHLFLTVLSLTILFKIQINIIFITEC